MLVEIQTCMCDVEGRFQECYPTIWFFIRCNEGHACLFEVSIEQDMKLNACEAADDIITVTHVEEVIVVCSGKGEEDDFDACAN